MNQDYSYQGDSSYLDDKKNKQLFINTNIQNQYGVPMMPASSQPLASPSSSSHWKEQSGAPGFVLQKQLLPIVNEGGDGYAVSFAPRVEGGFFMYDGVWTCYRRNFFRVLSAFNISSLHNPMERIMPDENVPLYVQYNGQNHMVANFRMNIAAFSNNSYDKQVELVSHSNKRDKTGNAAPSPKCVIPGGNDDDPSPPKTPLTPAAPDRARVSTMAQFDRIQFRTATANNGKRKAIQQYFRLCLELYAECADGSSFKIAESTSENIVVRGRSPGHYADVERIKERKKVKRSGYESSFPYAILPDRRNSWTSSLMSYPSALPTGPMSAMAENNFSQNDIIYQMPMTSINNQLSPTQLYPTNPDIFMTPPHEVQTLSQPFQAVNMPENTWDQKLVINQVPTAPPTRDATPNMTNKSLHQESNEKEGSIDNMNLFNPDLGIWSDNLAK